MAYVFVPKPCSPDHAPVHLEPGSEAGKKESEKKAWNSKNWKKKKMRRAQPADW